MASTFTDLYTYTPPTHVSQFFKRHLTPGLKGKKTHRDRQWTIADSMTGWDGDGDHR